MSFFANYRETLGNLFKKPATLPFPDNRRPEVKGLRGHVAIDLPACIFCGICQRRCPTRAITVSKPDTQWRIVRMHCIQCGACVEACPKKCLALEPAMSPPAPKPVAETFGGLSANADVSPGREGHA